MTSSKPIVIAGPCAAESFALMDEVAENLVKLSADLGFDYVFKASFDKANRTSVTSKRGPGFDQALDWFQQIKAKYKVPVLTDVHETYQVEPVAKAADWLQIPAFLCRQTDLVVEAAAHAKFVNIKKGQFLAPDAMQHIADKAKITAKEQGRTNNVFVTERGASFGYGNLVVDMRAFPIMAKNYPVIFDITHSTQLPASGSASSGGERRFAPTLARAATATGCLSGFFLEVHTNPSAAISDKDAQLTVAQATTLLKQIIPLWYSSKEFSGIDSQFVD